ncbi:MAG: hypothetical protein J6A75_01150 [Lachnospiraceae bacterium]|nr:hypothetical protein [Lachnospiraceae bacterium]
MNKVNRIRILFIFTVLLGIGCYQAFGLENTEDTQIPLPKKTVISDSETEDTQKLLTVNQNMSYEFVIIEEEDYLTVYYADRETIYEYTDIQYSGLPDMVRQKIRKGYWIKNEAELFGFLENYSS